MGSGRRLLALLPVIAAAAGAGCRAMGSGPCDSCGDNDVVNLDVWAAPEGDLFVAGYRAGQGLLRRFANGAWVPFYQGGFVLTSTWGTSAQDFFVLDMYDAMLHYRHGSWETWTFALPDAGPAIGQAWALWGTANDDLFVAGLSGIILHFDGVAWQPMTSPTTNGLKGMWGTTHDNVIAVGAQGTIVRYDGAAWSLVPSPTTAELNAVWGSSATDVFIVGDTAPGIAHVILHFDGNAVTVMHEGESGLRGIHGTGPDRVFAVGGTRGVDRDSGSVLRFDGATWRAQPVAVDQRLWDVWVNPDGSAILVGPGNTIVELPGG
jgi:hypothetical protein